MATQYPSINDKEFDLLKKLVNNTALLGDEELGDVASITGTANEITASSATGAVTLSLPAALTFTGKTVTGGTFASPTLTTPNIGVATGTSLTAPAATNLTLAGGSTGASLTLGQGTNGSVTITPAETGRVIIEKAYIDLSATAQSTVEIMSNTTAAIDKGGSLTLGGAWSGVSTTQFGAIKGAKENATVDNYAGYLSFWTRPAGSTSVEAARITSTRNILIGGTTDITGSGGLKVFGTTAANSTTTGAFQCAGGAGFASPVWIGMNSASNAALNIVDGNTSGRTWKLGAGVGTGTVTEFNLLDATASAVLWKSTTTGFNVLSTTASTSTTTGSLINAGGFGNAGAFFNGGNATITGDLTVSGGNVGVGGAIDTAWGLVVRSLALTGTNQTAIVSNATFTSAATTLAAAYSATINTAAAAFTVTTSYGYQVGTPVLGAGSAITTNTGLYVANQGDTGITNAYGIDIAAQSGAATTNVGFRNAGTSLLTGLVAIGGATVSSSTAIILPAGTTGVSSIRVPHGSAPTSPVDGDMWTTTAGLFVRVNGVTVGPLAA